MSINWNLIEGIKKEKAMKKSILLALALIAISITIANAEPGGIILYKTSNWTGDSLTIHEREISNLGEYGWNDVVRSFEVTAGTWRLYRDDNYQGRNPHDVFGPFTSTSGVNGTGRHTFGDNPDSPSGNTTSLRRMPDTGIMFFEDTHTRGRALHTTTSIPRLPHDHDNWDIAGIGGYLGLKPFVWGDTISSWFIGSGDWTLYQDSYYRGYSGYTKPGGWRNDSISSVFRSDDRFGSEVGDLFPDDPDDERLLRPRNSVAVDSGNWGDEVIIDGNSAKIGPSRGIVTAMDIRLNGFSGTFYTTCAGLAFYHLQHLVRLPNKDGRAYFAVTMSNSSSDLDASDGFMLVFRLDEDAYDAKTDLVIDSPGTDGEYIWSQHFNGSSPIGDWNHPGKMDVLGGVLVVAAEQWGSNWCDGVQGSDLDAVLFYDVRDPENPKYWGKLTADDLGIALQDIQTFGAWVTDEIGLDATRRVINSVALDHINGEVLLSVGGNGKRKLFRAIEYVLPYRGAWSEIGDGNALSNSHGITFKSYEENATDPDASPGTERIMFFDGSTTECKVKDGKFDGINCISDVMRASLSSIAFSRTGLNSDFWSIPPGSIPPGEKITAERVGGRNYPWPVGGEKSTDASSLYVTTTQRPVIYIPPLTWDAVTAPLVDYVEGLQRFPERYSLQPVGWNFWGLEDVVGNGNPSGYFNRFYQVHLPEPPTVVTSIADDGPGSLRQVMAEVRNGTVIGFAPNLNGQEILLTKEISTLKRLTIDASDLSSGIRISGNNSSRIFSVLPSATLVLNNLTITGGRAENDFGG
ncbi:MAG: beta/gamma crystallin-related protein, partial [Desulfobacterales bacterium]